MPSNEFDCSRIDELTTGALAARLDELMTRERHCLIEFLLHLASFDRRRGYLELGYDSLFVYCRDALKLSKGTAYRRAAVARLIRRLPAIVEYLRDGRLCTTSVCLLRKVLNEENHRALLERASTMTEDEIKRLAAALNPKADLADSIRRVPARIVPVVYPALAVPAEASGSTLELQAPSSNLAPAMGATAPAASADTAPQVAWVRLPPKPTEIEPLSADRYAVRMTVSQEFIDEFRQIKDALSHVVPSGEMEDVLRECMRIARDVCERRMLGSKRARAPRSAADTLATDSETAPPVISPSPDQSCPAGLGETDAHTATEDLERPADSAGRAEMGPDAGSSLEPKSSRYIPVEVRREVFERDQGCCTFVGTEGRRCRSTYRLQFHHRVPSAKGGPPTAENLTLHCARHNIHQAYEDYGAAHMDRFLSPREASVACHEAARGSRADVRLGRPDLRESGRPGV